MSSSLSKTVRVQKVISDSVTETAVPKIATVTYVPNNGAALVTVDISSIRDDQFSKPMSLRLTRIGAVNTDVVSVISVGPSGTTLISGNTPAPISGYFMTAQGFLSVDVTTSLPNGTDEFTITVSV